MSHPRSGAGVVPAASLTTGLLMVMGLACLAPPPTSFGSPCVDAGECAGLQCRRADGAVAGPGVEAGAAGGASDPADGRRCLPPRASGDVGERCDNAVPGGTWAPALDSDPGVPVVVLDQRVFFGDAVDDVDVCGRTGAPDVSLRFGLAVDVGLTVAVDDEGVAVGLRRIDASVCNDAAATTCGVGLSPDAKRPSLTLPRVLAGEYEIVLDGEALRRGAGDEPGVRVTITTIGCPLGYLPFGNEANAGECVGFRPMQPLLRARGNPGIGVLQNDEIAIVGGIGKDGLARADGDLFSAEREGFSFVDGQTTRVAPLVVGVGDLIAVAGGHERDRQAVETLDRDAINVGDVLTSEIGQVHDVVFLDEPILLTDVGAFAVRNTTVRAFCNDANGAQCGVDSVCLDSGCVCVGPRCAQDATAALADLRSVAFSAGTRAVRSGSESFLISTGEVDVGYRRFVRAASGAISEARPMPGPTRADSGLVRVGRFLYAVGGVGVDGAPSAAIERIDVSAETVTAAGALSRPVAGVRPQVLRDRFIVVAGTNSDVVDVFDTTSGRLLTMPPMSEPRASPGVAVDRDGVLIAGGFGPDGVALGSVERLEIVARSASVPAPSATCAAAPITGQQPVAGSTGGARDRFRDSLCVFNQGVGDDHWELVLDEPASLEVLVEPTDNYVIPMRVSISDGLCAEESRVVACGVERLTVPTLPAGRWFVSIETAVPFFNTDPDILDGRPYSLQIVRGEPEVCTGDAADPVDDLPLGGTFLAGTDDPERFPSREGVLCPGDVDHVLVGHLGIQSDVFVTGLSADVIAVAAVAIDEVASVAAGVPVAGEVISEFVPYVDWQRDQPGFFAVRIGPVPGLESRLGWTLVQSFDCEPDATDSQVPGLDDGTSVARARRLTSGASLSVSLCSPADRDIVVIDPDRPGDLVIDISSSGVVVELFEIDGDALGAPLDVDVVIDDFGRAELRLPERRAFGMRFALSADEEEGSASIDFSIPPVGDSCDAALPLPSSSGSLSQTSAAFRNDINAGDVGDCTTYSSPGEDIVYVVPLASGETFTGTLQPDEDFDVAVYLLEACPAGDFADVCVVGEDQGGRSAPDAIVFQNNGPDADFFVVLDSFYGESWSGTLSWTIQ